MELGNTFVAQFTQSMVKDEAICLVIYERESTVNLIDRTYSWKYRKFRMFYVLKNKIVKSMHLSHCNICP